MGRLPRVVTAFQPWANIYRPYRALVRLREFSSAQSAQSADKKTRHRGAEFDEVAGIVAEVGCDPWLEGCEPIRLISIFRIEASI